MLSDDIKIYEVLSKLDLEDIRNYCKTNKTINEWCKKNKEEIYAMLLKREFPEAKSNESLYKLLTKLKPDHIRYKELEETRNEISASTNTEIEWGSNIGGLGEPGEQIHMLRDKPHLVKYALRKIVKKMDPNVAVYSVGGRYILMDYLLEHLYDIFVSEDVEGETFTIDDIKYLFEAILELDRLGGQRAPNNEPESDNESGLMSPD